MEIIVGFFAFVIFVVILDKVLRFVSSKTPGGMRVARTFYKQVHGIFHKNRDGSSRQKIIRDCWQGEKLDLILEPDNRFDRDAIKVCRRVSGEQIGYWPAEGDMAEQLRAGWKFEVSIDEIYSMPENEKKLGVRMKIDVMEEVPFPAEEAGGPVPAKKA